MAVVSAFIFAGAFGLIVAVIAGTLVPSWQRIIDALAGNPVVEPRLMLARSPRVVRADRRAPHPAAQRFREAA